LIWFGVVAFYSFWLQLAAFSKAHIRKEEEEEMIKRRSLEEMAAETWIY